MIIRTKVNVWPDIDYLSWHSDDARLIDKFDIALLGEPIVDVDIIPSVINKAIQTFKFETEQYPFIIKCFSTRFTYHTINSKPQELGLFFISMRDKSAYSYGSSLPMNSDVPELVISTNMDKVSVHRVYTIYEASANYRGEIFGDPTTFIYYLKREPELKTSLNELTFDAFKKLFDMFKIEFTMNSSFHPTVIDRTILMLYNMFSSTLRDLDQRNSLLPPVEL